MGFSLSVITFFHLISKKYSDFIICCEEEGTRFANRLLPIYNNLPNRGVSFLFFPFFFILLRSKFSFFLSIPFVSFLSSILYIYIYLLNDVDKLLY